MDRFRMETPDLTYSDCTSRIILQAWILGNIVMMLSIRLLGKSVKSR